MDRKGRGDQIPVPLVVSSLATALNLADDRIESLPEHSVLCNKLIQLSLDLELCKNKLIQANDNMYRQHRIMSGQLPVGNSDITRLLQNVELRRTAIDNLSGNAGSASQLQMCALVDESKALKNSIQMIANSRRTEAERQTKLNRRSVTSIDSPKQHGRTVGTQPPFNNRKNNQKDCRYIVNKEQIEIQNHLQHLAMHDELTGLPNRRFLNESLPALMAAARRDGSQLGVALLDLDQFKMINDTHGHDVGDKVLVETAKRLQNSIGSNDFVARISGDEFTLIIRDFRHRSELENTLQTISDEFTLPFRLSTTTEIVITASIGVSIYPTDAVTEIELMKCADIAMYEAKSSGCGHVQFFNQEMERALQRKYSLQKELRTSVVNEDFEPWYQPVYHCSTNSFESIEMLTHWRHSTRGLLPPDEFMKLAEECGAIETLGYLILKNAFKQQHKLSQSGFGHIMVSVNISPHQIIAPGFTEKVAHILRSRKADARRIEFALTENALHDTGTDITNVILELHALGIRFSIDDFGAGYSSFIHLAKLPIHKIKIDESIIRGIPYDKDSVAIFNSFLSMGEHLQITVAAKGVESQAQYDYVHSAGCNEIQGSLMAKPVPDNRSLSILNSASTGVKTIKPQQAQNPRLRTTPATA